MSSGVVAAGHAETASAGARVLREGGNAVDAAIAAVMASCVTESPLTGLGAGGYMLVHTADENVLLDFFVAAPGLGEVERRSELVPAPIHFTEESVQVFHIGAASCGVPGTPAGLAEASRRFGSLPLGELILPAVELAREGVRITPEQAYFAHILEPVLTHEEAGRAIYAPDGTILGENQVFRFPALADALELLAAEGDEPFYRGEIAAALSDWVLERGGTLSREDLAAYRPLAREPVSASFRGCRILTNPPPSSGGILIALALELLDRGCEPGRIGVEQVVGVMERAQSERTREFLEGLHDEEFARRFLASDRLGSTTHITAVDRQGGCASVTCSNGTGSGLVVPGTGVHLNNMLGEEDLNPLGFHLHGSARRLPSMMSPTVVLGDGRFRCGLGSGGSNRIRSAILQTLVGLLDHGLDLAEAIERPRVHYEAGAVQAEPGVDPGSLEALEAGGLTVVRWSDRNVFFGGVHAVATDPRTGALVGAGDPRRGGAVALG